MLKSSVLLVKSTRSSDGSRHRETLTKRNSERQTVSKFFFDNFLSFLKVLYEILCGLSQLLFLTFRVSLCSHFDQNSSLFCQFDVVAVAFLWPGWTILRGASFLCNDV